MDNLFTCPYCHKQYPAIRGRIKTHKCKTRGISRLIKIRAGYYRYFIKGKYIPIERIGNDKWITGIGRQTYRSLKKAKHDLERRMS